MWHEWSSFRWSYLDFAAKLQVGQVPSINFVRLELEVVCFALEVEQRDVLDRVFHRVGDNTLSVDPEKPTPVCRVAFLQNELFVAEVEESVKLLAVAESDHHVLAGKSLLPKVTVSVLQIDLVQQFRLDIGDVVRLKSNVT